MSVKSRKQYRSKITVDSPPLHDVRLVLPLSVLPVGRTGRGL